MASRSGAARFPSTDFNIGELLTVWTHDVRRTCEAGIERMDGAQDLDRLLRILHRSVHQRSFERADIALWIARRAIPCGGNDALVVVDLGFLDLDPVRERPARRLGETDTLGFLRPGFRFPLFHECGVGIAGLDISDQLVLEVAHLIAGPLARS